MELRHLRYFVMVAEELNFRRAAERLYMAQPPLSIQIRHLEEEIGTPLFTREARRVALTEAGKAFLTDARGILERVDAAVTRAARIGRGDEGCLRVGFASSTTYDLLPKAVRLFRERYPDVDLRLSELLGREQADWLESHQIDVGIAVQLATKPGIVVEPVAEVPLVVALPTGHPLAALPEVPLASLDGEPYVQFPSLTGSGFAQYLADLFRGAGIQPRLVQITEELQTALGLVAAGLGFTLAPGSVQILHREGLTFRPFAAPIPAVEIGVARRKDERSPLASRFVEVCREAAHRF